MDNLFVCVKAAWEAPSAEQKIALTRQAQQALQADALALDPVSTGLPGLAPGRPARPQLVHPRQLQRRSLHTAAGRRVLVHALADIEFNAINLALDAVCRFQNLPRAYYADWLRVAVEESGHFQLLQARLHELELAYGDLPAHDGLWDMARRTAHDPLARMALVPRVLEARGLDVTPGMIKQLTASGDTETSRILGIILTDEIQHVAIGSRWFEFLCQQRGLEPVAEFKRLIDTHFHGQLRGPFNREARLQAGFSGAELDELNQGQ